MKLASISCAILVTVAATACEKDRGMPEAKASGALSSPEAGVLSHLPAGANVVFGGNIYEAQRWLAKSALARMTKAMMPAGMNAWNECLAKQPNVSMVGAGQVTDGTLRMPMFMKGLTVAALRECAAAAKLPATVDPDGRFIAVEISTPQLTYQTPYLAVDDGVYARVSMDLGGLAAGRQAEVTNVTRADLEADQAAVAKTSLADDRRMLGWLGKVDRSRAVYFVGSGEGTAIADKLGMVYGTFDLRGGLAIDVTAELREPAAADQAVSAFREAKGKLDQIPASMSAIKDVIRAVRLARTSKGLRVVATITDQQLDAVMTQIGPLLPQLGG